MTLKCFHELLCENIIPVQQQALAYLNTVYDLSDQRSLNTDLWLKIDTRAFLKSSPLLIEWFQSLGLKIREVALTVINSDDGAKLHIDELPIIAKINFPLLNYHHVINEWWHVPDNILNSIAPITNRFGSNFYNLGSVDLNQCEKIASVEMTGPIVFNSQIPHRVVVTPGRKFPRVVLTCMFYNQPLQYLE
jgi:hypothetical protein